MNQTNSLHRYAKLVSGFTFLLLFAGGLVTSTGSGLAVPDWPLSFGKFFPRMTGGVLYEHGHRMVAGCDIALTFILVFWIFRSGASAILRRLGAAAVGAIVLQACLGGATVLLRLPPAVSVAHAGLAQIFFCITVSMALITSPFWNEMAADRVDRATPSITPLAWITTGLVYAQILLGAVMRHIGAGLAIPDFPRSFGSWIPPAGEWSFAVGINFAHRVGACVVFIFVLWTAGRILAFKGNIQPLRRLAFLLLAVLGTQILLGGLTVWTHRGVIPTTAHVVNGALLLASSLVTALVSGRLFAKSSASLFANPSAVRYGS